MPITMKEIAAIAGVSRQAVAAALDNVGTSKVSEATRKKILAIAREMNYVPNQSARSLKGAASMTIGVYGVPYASVLSQCFFNEMSLFLDRHGYNLMASYGMTCETAEQAVRRLIARNVDGIIVTTQYNPFTRWNLPPMPAVFTPPGYIPGCDIVVDHAAGTAAAVKEIITKGRKKFLYIMPDFFKNGNPYPNMEKFRGFQEALSEAGMEGMKIHLSESDGDGDKLLARIRGMAPDVIFCSNDYFAGRLIHLLLSAGIKIPDDIMIVGYDGLAVCDLCAVPLTTVIQPLQKMAEAVVDLLLQRIKAKNTSPEPAEIKLLPEFYPSASTGTKNNKSRELPIYDSYSSLEANWNEHAQLGDVLL